MQETETPFEASEVKETLSQTDKVNAYVGDNSPAVKGILKRDNRPSSSSRIRSKRQESGLVHNNNGESTVNMGKIDSPPYVEGNRPTTSAGGSGSGSKSNLNSGPSSARLVIETTLRKSAGILSEFTENTISRSGTNLMKDILQPERFGISNRPWCDVTPSVQCSSVSTKGRKKPDMSKLPPNIVELLKEDSCSSVISKAVHSKKYHSKKMALRQCDDTSSKMDLPVARIKSSSSSDRKAPKIVVVSAPLQLESQNNSNTNKTPPRTPIIPLIEGRTVSRTKNPYYKKLNHTPIIQSIKEAVDKVKAPHVSTVKFPTDQYQQPLQQHISGKNETRVGTSVRKSQKVTLGVEKGIAFILGPKTKHPYYNTFGPMKDINGLMDNTNNCKWVINIGNFHDNEITFTLVDDNLTIMGFRQPSLKYPEGQSVSESITIPPGFDINNLRIYRSKYAAELLVLEEILTKPETNQGQGTSSYS